MSLHFGDTPPAPARARQAQLPSPAEARRIAITHATAIEVRKALEASILNSLVLLLDFPPPAPSASPPPLSLPGPPQPSGPWPASVVRALKHHLRFFTPADYDSLLEERNVAGLCAYTLCAKPPRLCSNAKRSRLVRMADGRWVERKQVERFCGADCARRALWLRVQLSTEPAWVRRDVVAGLAVDEHTGAVTGVELDAASPPASWDEAACGLRLLDEALAARSAATGLWGDADARDVGAVARELAEIGITGVPVSGNGDGRGRSQVTSVHEGGAPCKSPDPNPLMTDIVERRPESEVGIVLPSGGDGAGAIEGYIPSTRS